MKTSPKKTEEEFSVIGFSPKNGSSNCEGGPIQYLSMAEAITDPG